MEFHLAHLGIPLAWSSISIPSAGEGGSGKEGRGPGRKTEIDHFPCGRVSGGDAEKSPSDCFSSPRPPEFLSAPLAPRIRRASESRGGISRGGGRG
jgi:hypothetical protein